MLTEQFINLCCTVLLDENPRFTKEVLNDIGNVLNSYKEDQIPLNFKKKINLCKTVFKLKIEGKNSESIIDDVTVTGQFKEIESFLTISSERKIEEEKIDNVIKQIKDRKRYTSLLKDLPLLENYVKQFNTNSFSDINESLKNWDSIISKSYSRILEERRHDSYNRISNLDLFSDQFDKVLNQVEISYSGKNSISTGYSELDNYINGGFEPGRLYIFAGASGDGKSVLLMNFLRNGVQRLKPSTQQKKEIFIYFTLENLIDESLVRLYCSLTKQSTNDLMKDFNSKKGEIEEYIKNWQKKYNSIVVMSYFPPTLTSTADLSAYIEQVEHRYKDVGEIKAIYVDYLDLLKSGQTFDLYRLEQGQVTIDLKVLAVLKNVPVISLTQLNRGGYDKNQPMNLTQIGEAIKKVEHSDFVALIRSLFDEQQSKSSTVFNPSSTRMEAVIKKNRSGPKEKTVSFIVNFSQFRIDDNSRDISVPFENNNLVDESFI